MLKKIAFHPSGKPRSWLRNIILNKEKKIRPISNSIFYNKDGDIRDIFNQWANQSPSPVCNLNIQSLENWLKGRWKSLESIPIYSDNIESRRITIVTDSIGNSSLFGGVGTAMILGSIWASRSKSKLRIVTRMEKPDTSALARVLKANGLTHAGEVDFCFCPLDSSRELPVGNQDLFISTSWWTTRALLSSVGAQRIIYLLQEDERMFYPHGDDRLECHETLTIPVQKVIVNTNLLWDHLTKGPDKIEGLLTRGLAFEPAFTSTNKDNRSNGKKRLFFYARPDNLRNLFATGMATIGEAVKLGALNPKDWELHFIGSNIPEIKFPGGLKVIIHSTMSWAEYQTLMGTMNAGFVLMYTPHPSYPPFDLAVKGIPVLTNKFGNKIDLSNYSHNIICTALKKEDLVEGIRTLVSLADNNYILDKNRSHDSIERNWESALNNVVSKLDNIWEDIL